MKKFEALALASQLGLTIKSVSDFQDQLADRGRTIGVCHRTANWVVMVIADRSILAEVA